MLVAAGCGGSKPVSHEAYGTALRGATADLGGLTTDLAAAMKTSSPAKEIAQLHAIQLGLRTTGTNLQAVTPSPDLKAAHGELVAGVQDMADAIDLLVQAERLQASSPAKAQAALRKFAADPALPRVQAAAAKITKAGVDAGF
jgi:hypothetical protein